MKKARLLSVTPARAALPGDLSEALANAMFRLQPSPTLPLGDPTLPLGDPSNQSAGVSANGAARNCTASSAPTMACFVPEMAMEWASAAPIRLVLINATCAPTLNRPSQAQI